MLLNKLSKEGGRGSTSSSRVVYLELCKCGMEEMPSIGREGEW